MGRGRAGAAQGKGGGSTGWRQHGAGAGAAQGEGGSRGRDGMWAGVGQDGGAGGQGLLNMVIIYYIVFCIISFPNIIIIIMPESCVTVT